MLEFIVGFNTIHWVLQDTNKGGGCQDEVTPLF